MSSFDAPKVLALLDAERQRSLGLARELDAARAALQRLRNMTAAYEMLGRDRGFTEDDARDAWMEAGYGGL